MTIIKGPSSSTTVKYGVIRIHSIFNNKENVPTKSVECSSGNHVYYVFNHLFVI